MRRVQTAVIGALSVCLASCAVYFPRIPTCETRTRSGCEGYTGAVRLAEQSSKSYKDFVQRERAWSKTIGFGLIGLAGSAAGLGIVGTSDSTAPLMGVSGATTLSAFLWGRSNLDVYELGERAMDCVVASIPAPPNRVSDYEDAIAKLAKETAAFEKGIDELRNRSGKLGPPTVEQMTPLIAVQTIAEQCLARTSGLQQELNEAGKMVRVAVGRIDLAVRDAARRFDPDPAALRDKLGFGEIPPVPKPSPPPGNPKDLQVRMTSALQTVPAFVSVKEDGTSLRDTDVQKLWVQATVMGGLVEELLALEPVVGDFKFDPSLLAPCVAQSESAAAFPTISISGPDSAITPTKPQSLVIQGGSGPPYIVQAQSDAGDLTITSQIVGKVEIVGIALKDKIVAKPTYTLIVVDPKASRSKSVELKTGS